MEKQSKIPQGNNSTTTELWNRINYNDTSSLPPSSDNNRCSSTTSSNTIDYFTEIQKNRTVNHPKLKQPNAEDEAFFLRKNPPQDNSPQDCDGELEARLSAALYGSQKHSGEDFGNKISQEDSSLVDDNGPSPTSTLMFPDSSLNAKYFKSSPSSNSTYCCFVNGEQEEQQQVQEDNIRTPHVSKVQPTSSTKTNNSVSELETHSKCHRFVVCADPQLGMTTLNREWETEIRYCKEAVRKINSLQPRPKYACVCGDLVDMEESFYYNNPKGFWKWDKPVVDRVRKQQIQDYKDIFSQVHPDIALVCVCGNHDVGNRPTPETIQSYKQDFGDDYFAFWVNGTYNIGINNVLFDNPDGAPAIFQEQLEWLEDRLQYANKFGAAQIFVHAHHPWFLYHEDEEDDELLKDGIPFPDEWLDEAGTYKGFVMTDFKFCIPKEMRNIAFNLFRKYNVSACFCGHFHQNIVRKTSWGMDMIVTGPISMLLESTGNKNALEKGRGIRIVDVTQDHITTDPCEHVESRRVGAASFTHYFENF